MTPEQRQLAIAYKTCFGGESGKTVLADLETKVHFERAHISSSGPIDTARLIADEARRALVCYIRNLIKADLDKKEPEKQEQEII
jgi:hypothetical protein